jgi:hypothetical protein
MCAIAAVSVTLVIQGPLADCRDSDDLLSVNTVEYSSKNAAAIAHFGCYVLFTIDALFANLVLCEGSGNSEVFGEN